MLTQGHLPSCDGVHSLSYFSFIPEKPSAAVLIIHGMAEYKERYIYTAEKLCNEGFAVYCYDQLGHGQSVKEPWEYGYFAKKDGRKALLADVDAYIAMIRKNHPGIPVVLLGHSMGSFIVRCAAPGCDIDGLAVSGTGGGNPALGMGIFICRIYELLGMGKKRSKFIDSLAMGGNSKGFENEKYPNRAWLSKEEYIQKDMEEKTFMFTVSGMKDMFTLYRSCSKKSWYDKFPRSLPCYLFSGANDPIGDRGKGFTAVCDKLRARGCQVQSRLYSGGRHEMLNETERDEVISHLAEFISGVKIKQGGSDE